MVKNSKNREKLIFFLFKYGRQIAGAELLLQIPIQPVGHRVSATLTLERVSLEGQVLHCLPLVFRTIII
jgi:hypothetical protein